MDAVTKYYVYVLKSQYKRFLYVGLTNNLEKRYRQHQNGQQLSTKAYRPFEIVHSEQYATRHQAREREKYLKSGVGKEWLKTLYPYSN